MKVINILLGMVAILMVALGVHAAAINFSKPLPSAEQGTLGVNQQLEIQKAAMEEMRTKMVNWAAYTGYSSATSR
jgi:hypothetical protein